MDSDATSRERDSALGFLLSRIDYERSLSVPYGLRQFKLDRMRQLLAHLGDPQAGLTIVHIAGTKGKGSTAAMIAAVLTAARYRTGLFTSPHMARLEERINIDGNPCSSAELVDLVARLRPIVEAMDAASPELGPGETGLTYFELTTAMALLSFADRAVDVAVLEVGMGGRLDSTNVCRPCVSVITSISFDHMQQLGNTLAEIAGEKAGIVKPGVPVISGVTEDEPRQVIQTIANEAGSPVRQLGVDFDYRYDPPRLVDQVSSLAHVDVQLAFSNPPVSYQRLGLTLLGRHQAANAAVALAALVEVQAQGFTIPELAIRRGLSQVRWPARVEVVARRPTVIIDAAHNAASVAALAGDAGRELRRATADPGVRHDPRQGRARHAAHAACAIRPRHPDALYEQSARRAAGRTSGGGRFIRRDQLPPGAHAEGGLDSRLRPGDARGFGVRRRVVLYRRRDAPRDRRSTAGRGLDGGAGIGLIAGRTDHFRLSAIPDQDLHAMNRHAVRRLDADSDASPADLHNGDGNRVANDDRLVRLSREHEHGSLQFVESGRLAAWNVSPREWAGVSRGAAEGEHGPRHSVMAASLGAGCVAIVSRRN